MLSAASSGLGTEKGGGGSVLGTRPSAPAVLSVNTLCLLFHSWNKHSVPCLPCALGSVPGCVPGHHGSEGTGAAREALPLWEVAAHGHHEGTATKK